jgi:diadenosine tetraphosphatase ApaH/serine/threonine PP2A family protein phosphatase
MVASEQTIEHVIQTFHAAAETNRNTPLREGNVVVAPPEVVGDVLVAGDLHGNRLNFNRLCQIADLDARPTRHLVLQEVCHGGPLYPSGTGCMSHLLLEDVAELKVRRPNQFHFILSNHELAELTDFPITKSRRLLNVLFRCGLEEMYGAAGERVRQACLEFIRSCPLAVRVARRLFICHSAPDNVDRGPPFDATIFTRELDNSDLTIEGAVFRLVWGRDFRKENAAAFAELVDADVLIHGHEPCSEGFAAPNKLQIVLDSSSQRASYVLLPTNRQLTAEEVVDRIQRLF